MLQKFFNNLQKIGQKVIIEWRRGVSGKYFHSESIFQYSKCDQIKIKFVKWDIKKGKSDWVKNFSFRINGIENMMNKWDQARGAINMEPDGLGVSRWANTNEKTFHFGQKIVDFQFLSMKCEEGAKESYTWLYLERGAVFDSNIIGIFNIQKGCEKGMISHVN